MLSSRFGQWLWRGYCGILERSLLSVPTMMESPAISGCTTTLLGGVRHRYRDTSKPTFRHWGYEDKMKWRGPLPRIPREDIPRVPEPPFAPTNQWTEKKALFGQNDYIDILGSPDIHPVRISYDVPHWLKGFRGNEYQMLLRKRKFFGRQMRAGNPEEAHKLKKRLKYLFKFLNRKQKTRFHPFK